MSRLFALLSVICCFQLWSVYAQANCRYDVMDSYYDLAPLTRKGTDKDWEGSYTDFRIVFNICANVIGTNNCWSQVAAYYVWGTWCGELGMLSKQTWGLIEGPTSAGSGVILTYHSDLRCYDTYDHISIKIKCDQAVESAIVDKVIRDSDCSYSVEMRSKHGCPAGGSGVVGEVVGGLSGGSIFIIIFFVAIVLYIAGGVTFNIVKNHTGCTIDSFPQLNFWTEFAALVKDGAMWSYDKSKERFDQLRGR